MATTLGEIVKCLQIPYASFLFVLLIILVPFRNKIDLLLLLIVLFVLGWRTVVGVNTSRYCCFLYILFVVTLSFVSNKYKHAPWFRKVIIHSLIVLFIFNTIKCFSGAENKYYIDLQDDLSYLSASNSNADFFIDVKDYRRINALSINAREWSTDIQKNTYCFLKQFQNQYEFWNNDAFFIFPERKVDSTQNKFPEDIMIYKKIRQYITSRSPLKHYSVFYCKNYLPKTYDSLCREGDPIIQELINSGSLKAYDSENDIYIYMYDYRVFWLIGKKLDPKTELLFHIYTNRPDLLPEERRKYRFDNRGFYFKSIKDISKNGRYFIFDQSIPKEYPITVIHVGLNTGKELMFFKSFDLTDK